MIKQDAINLLGGTPTKAAAAIGCRPQAVSQWPDPLTPRIEDRVTAAISRAKAKNSYKAGKNKAVLLPSVGAHE